MEHKVKIIPMGQSSVSDDAYLVITRIKNNLILRKMKQLGYKSVAEFCRKNQIHHADVGALINFRKLPLRDDGEWRENVWNISSALHCEPEELFTETQKNLIAKKKAHMYSLSEEKFLQLANQEQPTQLEDFNNKDLICKISDTLSPRQEKIIKQRFFENMTLDEVGKDEGCGGGRIRTLECMALNKMKNRYNMIKQHQIWQDET